MLPFELQMYLASIYFNFRRLSGYTVTHPVLTHAGEETEPCFASLSLQRLNVVLEIRTRGQGPAAGRGCAPRARARARAHAVLSPPAFQVLEVQ